MTPHVRRWVQGDAMQLPFDTASFDAATMGYGLRNVADIPAALRELHRVLRPGALSLCAVRRAPGTSSLVRRKLHLPVS